VGVDPCAPLGIGAVGQPFTYELARKMPPVDLIVANNVLAHVDDLWDVFHGIDHLLKEDGALVFEVQYFPSMVSSGLFDMIYHEHRDYHTLNPWPRFLKRFGLVITQVDFIDTHGGSIRLFCERPGIGKDVDIDIIDWRAFKHRIEAEKCSLLEQIHAVTGPLVAFGATAKACTLIHQLGIAERIDFCIDSTESKQYRYLPGTDIQILPPDRLLATTKKSILLTAWNFESAIRAQYPQAHFIVPFKEALCPAS
jgi:hypothetical protein